MRCLAWVVAFGAVLLGGCYESDFPLDPTPRIRVDPALLGSWRCLAFDASPDEQPVTLVVGSTSEREYAVSLFEADKPPDRYSVYASALQGIQLLNIRELGADGAPVRQWIFGRSTLLRPNVLHVEVVSDAALRGVDKSRAAVRKAIETRRNDRALFQDSFACVKARDRSP